MEGKEMNRQSLHLFSCSVREKSASYVREFVHPS